MKNKINKLVSLFMVFFMTFGLFAPLAQAEISEGDKGTIIITNVNEKVDVKVYRLMDVHYDFELNQPVSPVYTWVSSIQDWVNANFESYKDANEFNTENVNEESAKEFYDALASEIRKPDSSLLDEAGSCTAGAPVDAPDGEKSFGCEIDNLEMGNYLVVIENGMKVYSPSSVNLVPTWNDDEKTWEMTTPATVIVKSQDVTIEKNVTSENGNNVAIGDTVAYELHMNVPQYPVKASNKTYVVGDKISSNLVIDFDSIEIFGYGDGIEEEEISADAYTLVTTPSVLNEEVGEVDFKVTFNYEMIKKYSDIVITYSASVKETVTIGSEGNENIGYFVYNNNPYGTPSYKVQEDSEYVYSYGINAKKVGDKKADEEGLAGAKFKVSTTPSGEATTESLKFIYVSDGEYRLALPGEEGAVEEIEVGSEEATKGKLLLTGLSAGTYYLKETQAPGGYNRLNEDITVIITDEKTGEVDGANGAPEITDSESGEVRELSDGLVPLVVVNKSGFTLPETGGIGTIIFTVVGIVLMGVGVIIFKKIRNKSNN